LFDLDNGTVTATANVELDWDVTATEVQRRDDAWLLAYTDRKPSAPARLIEYRDGALLDSRPLAASERSAWPSLAPKPDGADEWAAVGATTFYTVDEVRTRLRVVNGSERRLIELAAGQGRELAPSPDGKLLAIAQFRFRLPVIYGRPRGPEDLIISVIDVATGERLWTRAVFARSTTTGRFAWSEDGSALVSLAGGVATVYDANTGTRLAERARGPVELRVRTDG
jgi:hypothetical protein